MASLLDDDPGTSGLLVQRLLNGSLPAVARIFMIVVDVRDVAALHVRAMTDPSAMGRRLPAGNGTFSLKEIADVLRLAFPAYAGKLPRFDVPDWMVRVFAAFDADARGNVGELGYVRRTEALDAQALLGRPFIAPEEAIREMARTVIAQGLA